jgi:hypothetical protein
MATTGYWDNKGDAATKVTWDNPEFVPEEKRSTGGWYYNPSSGNVDRWWTGTQQQSNPTSAEQLPSYLDNYQTGQYQQITVPDLKIPTADELKTQLTPSTPAPEPISRIALLEQQRNAMGVADLETELNTLKGDERLIQATLRETTGLEEGKQVSLGVMSGRITEEQRVAQTKLDYLNVRKATLVDELNTKYNAINTYINYAGMDYQDAVQAYENEFNQNVQIQNLLSGFRQEAWKYATDAITINETLKQNAIDNARANLTTITNAITSGNMNYGNLSSDEKLQIQKLEIQSGLPVGTISKMQISAKDKILGFSSDNTQVMVQDGNGGFKVLSTGLSAPSKGGSGATSSLTAAQKTALDKDIAARMTLDQLVAKYNMISPDAVYAEYNDKSPWGKAKESAEELKSKYNISAGSTSNVNQDLADAQAAIAAGADSEEVRRRFIEAYPDKVKLIDDYLNINY